MRGATSAATAYSGYSVPQTMLRRDYGVGRNLLDRLAREGEIDTFILGSRIRHVVVQSWLDYLRRCEAGGLPREPAEKARATAAYRDSVAKSAGARATALARSGWGPNHGKRGGSPHLTSKVVPPAQKSPLPRKRRSARTSSETASTSS
jgi:hypothetical protein